MSLMPPMSPEQLRDVARARQLEKYGRVISVGLEAPPLREVRPAPNRSAQVDRLQRETSTSPITAIVDGPVELPVRAVRWLNGIAITILEPPRTKKNHGRAFGIKQSKAYKHYRAVIVDSFGLLAARLNLPLADRPYNIRALYYVDKRGEPADLTGLHQGLFDALENAGVVSNDWYFRTADGSRVIAGDRRPRVEVLITALEGAS